jgi:catechol 2,3-dioxygenase-like lactoylglutathione lyase family enzyme
MLLSHVALVRSSEEESDRFFEEVLGLPKTRSKTVSSDLAAQLFDLEEEYKLVYYGKEGVQFEVFLSERRDFVETHLGHVCLEVDDAEDLLARCAATNLRVRRVARDHSFVTFIQDEDGNLFEIKEKP